MAPISDIRAARCRRSRRVLFVGNPTRHSDVSQWAMVRQWVVLQGLEPIRSFCDDVLCVIVTEDVLDGRCSSAESLVVRQARDNAVPCISVHDTTTIWHTTARVRARMSLSNGTPREGA